MRRISKRQATWKNTGRLCSFNHCRENPEKTTQWAPEGDAIRKGFSLLTVNMSAVWQGSLRNNMKQQADRQVRGMTSTILAISESIISFIVSVSANAACFYFINNHGDITGWYIIWQALRTVSKQGRDARSTEARYEIQKSLTLMNMQTYRTVHRTQQKLYGNDWSQGITESLRPACSKVWDPLLKANEQVTENIKMGCV